MNIQAFLMLFNEMVEKDTECNYFVDLSIADQWRRRMHQRMSATIASTNDDNDEMKME